MAENNVLAKNNLTMSERCSDKKIKKWGRGNIYQSGRCKILWALTFFKIK